MDYGSKWKLLPVSYTHLEKISDINRLSNIEVSKLKEKLMKTLVNGNLDFSKKYGKELFLRDREAVSYTHL